ncbi:unnamed protein product [Lactuca virosa]|uniref:Uncharacterized protein n=1 Tax=Lactuca virosa TaxID=75947 RepID=A0AAU9P8T4_9ASTR|nr:unnamed protein product [Lactuca virosa]
MKRTFLVIFLFFVSGLKDVTSYSQDAVPECKSFFDCIHHDCGRFGTPICLRHHCVCLGNGEQKYVPPHMQIDKIVYK